MSFCERASCSSGGQHESRHALVLFGFHAGQRHNCDPPLSASFGAYLHFTCTAHPPAVPSAESWPIKTAGLRLRNEMRFYPYKVGCLLAFVCFVSVTWITLIPSNEGECTWSSVSPAEPKVNFMLLYFLVQRKQKLWFNVCIRGARLCFTPPAPAFVHLSCR